MMARLKYLIIFLGLFLAIPSIALSQVVTNLNDAGPGSLRDVITNANPGDTITFSPALNGGTIVLSSVIQIVFDLTITGPGPENLTLSGGNTNRIFQIISPMTPETNVTISNLRFINGFASFGGAIVMDTRGDFECNNCVFESNTAESGGGGTGGAYATDAGEINSVFNNCTFRFNTTLCIGCGEGAPSTGGAIISSGNNTLEVRNSTFSHNSNFCAREGCPSEGGAINVNGSNNPNSVSSFTSINNTFVSNSSTCEGENCSAQGGAISIVDGEVTVNILFTTFSNNSVSCTGTGCIESAATIYEINDFGGPNTVNLGSSIFETLSPLGNCGGSNIFSLGYNIDNGNTCLVSAGPGDKPNTNPRLDPGGLRDNGGPTETIALLFNSPALDMASPGCPPPDTDQRGFARPEGTRCDIGAYEGFISSPVPTLSEWGLIATAAILGIVGFMVVRRRATA